MEKIICNPFLIPKMGKRSREIAEEIFDEDKVADNIIRFIGLTRDNIKNTPSFFAD